jgi:hypothetical protein
MVFVLCFDESVEALAAFCPIFVVTYGKLRQKCRNDCKKCRSYGNYGNLRHFTAFTAFYGIYGNLRHLSTSFTAFIYGNFATLMTIRKMTSSVFLIIVTKEF